MGRMGKVTYISQCIVSTCILLWYLDSLIYGPAGDPGVTLDIKYYSGVRGSNEGNLGAPKDQSPLMGQTELKK